MFGVKNYAQIWYLVYDISLSAVFFNIFPNANVSSSLDSNDTIFRQMKLRQGVSASSSFGVSVFNRNSTHTAMGVKQSAHITLYSYEKVAIAPSNCTSEGRPYASNNLIDLPHNAVLCDVVYDLNNISEAAIIQAKSCSF